MGLCSDDGLLSGVTSLLYGTPPGPPMPCGAPPLRVQKMLEYEEYRRLTSEQKIALLERGECPAGIWDFLCPFWWNHWKVRKRLSSWPKPSG